MNDIDARPIAIIDGDIVTIQIGATSHTIPTSLYREIREGYKVKAEGEIIRPNAIIDYLISGNNPVTMKAMVAREVDIQRVDDKKNSQLIFYILAGIGVAILCAAVAWVMIDKSSEAISTIGQTVVNTGNGLAIK